MKLNDEQKSFADTATGQAAAMRGMVKSLAAAQSTGMPPMVDVHVKDAVTRAMSDKGRTDVMITRSEKLCDGLRSVRDAVRAAAS